MTKKLTFSIELNGIDIPEKQQAEISKALNQTLMHKLGELDYTSSKAPKAGDEPLGATAGASFLLKDLINGGKMAMVMSKELATVVKQIQTQFDIPSTRGGVNIMFNQ